MSNVVNQISSVIMLLYLFNRSALLLNTAVLLRCSQQITPLLNIAVLLRCSQQKHVAAEFSGVAPLLSTEARRC